MDDQGDDTNSEPFIQYQGLPAYQQSERIFSDLSSRLGRNLMVPSLTPDISVNSIRDLKPREVTLEVLDAFMGSPPKEDPNLIRLKETGLTLARRVFKAPLPCQRTKRGIGG